MSTPTTRRALLALLLAGPALAARARDEALVVIVPGAAGSSLDQYARRLAGPIGTALGRTVVVDNRPSGNGYVAVGEAARARPDGLTLLCAGVNALALHPALTPRLHYNPQRDFAPVTLLVRGAPLLLVRPQGPATLADFIAAARARPGQLRYGSAGIGSAQHVAMRLLELRAGLSLVHAPYSRQPQVTTDLVGGHVDAAVEYPSVALPLVRDGRLRALAVLGPRRKPDLPTVPTADELGWPGLEVEAWIGLLAPAGTPAPTLASLHRAVAAALQEPAFASWAAGSGSEVVAAGPADFAAYLASEQGRWAGLIREAKLQTE